MVQTASYARLVASAWTPRSSNAQRARHHLLAPPAHQRVTAQRAAVGRSASCVHPGAGLLAEAVCLAVCAVRARPALKGHPALIIATVHQGNRIPAAQPARKGHGHLPHLLGDVQTAPLPGRPRQQAHRALVNVCARLDLMGQTVPHVDKVRSWLECLLYLW